MSDEQRLVLDLVRHSGLGAIAEECHRLAVARGKYHQGRYPWTIDDGIDQVNQEIAEWAIECVKGCSKGQVEEYGDILSVVLSIGHHMGYNVEQALRDAIQRNAERAREGV